MLPIKLDRERLTHLADHPNLKALVLMGSYARGDAGPHSDIDLLRFVSPGEGEGTSQALPVYRDGSYLLEGFLVTLTSVELQQVEDWFSTPEAAVSLISGLRRAQILVDREGTFAAIQRRAHAFTWDEALQQKAAHWVSQQMVGWIEEVHKGLEGLRRGDVGRLLNARFGCSWGLTNLMKVHLGVLVSGDNALYDEVGAAVGDVEWLRLRRTAFGIEDKDGAAPSLRQQVVAGLRLYVLTAALVEEVLEEGDGEMVRQTVALIQAELGNLLEESRIRPGA